MAFGTHLLSTLVFFHVYWWVALYLYILLTLRSYPVISILFFSI